MSLYLIIYANNDGATGGKTAAKTTAKIIKE